MKRFILLLLAVLLCISTPLYAQRTVVIINLRGGFDSLYAVQPYSSVLNTRRPYLFQEADDLTFLPSRSGVLNEGVHHEFPELVSAYNADEAVIIHQVGYNSQTNSSQLGYNILTRGVLNPTSTERRGWLQRIAQVNNLQAGNMVDLSAKSAAFAGGTFEPTRAYGLDNIDRFNGDYRHYYDSTFQITTLAAVSDSFGPGASQERYRNSFDALMATSSGFSDALDRMSWPSMGNGNPNRYPYDSFGYRLRETEMLIRNTSSTTAKVIYIEVEGFDNYRYQRWALHDRIEDLNDAIRTFRNRMKNAGLWDRVILAVIPDGGRSIGEAGEAPEDERPDRAYGVGTNFGGAFDVYLFSGAFRSGGRTLGSYQHDDLRQRYIYQRYHIMDVYQELMEAVGYQTAGAFESYPRKQLNLF